MENTSHDLFKESLSAKINRYEQTIEELKNINRRQLNNINELGKALEVKAEVEEHLRTEVDELKAEVKHWKELYIFATDKHIKRIRNDKK